MSSLLIICAAIVPLTVLFLSWRQCIKLVLVILIIEGAMRKWILPGAADFVYFAKDAVLIVGYIKYYSAPLPTLSHVSTQRIRTLIFISGVLIMLNIFNSALGSPLVGLVGARNYLLYIPLFFLMRHLFQSEEDLACFIRRYLLLSLPVFALALIQYSSSADSPLNIYVPSLQTTHMATVGENVRVTGTFSYIAGYSWYLQIVAALVFPFLLIAHSRIWRALLQLIFIAALGGIAMTGSRGPAVGLGIFFGGYFLLNNTFRKLRLYNRFIGTILISILVAGIWLNTAFENFYGRFNSNTDLPSRLIGCFVAPFNYMPIAGLIGYGTGATYQGALAVRSMFNLPPGEHIPVYYESEPERIILELGLILFVIWYTFRIVLLRELWRTYKALKRPLLRELALTAFLIHLIALPNQVVFQITFLVFYWFFAGFALLLPEIESREELKLSGHD